MTRLKSRVITTDMLIEDFAAASNRGGSPPHSSEKIMTEDEIHAKINAALTAWNDMLDACTAADWPPDWPPASP